MEGVGGSILTFCQEQQFPCAFYSQNKKEENKKLELIS